MIARVLDMLSTLFCHRCEKQSLVWQSDSERIGWKALHNVVVNTPGMNNITSYANSDDSYKLVDYDHLRAFLEDNDVSNREYIPEKHDCDDFSFILMGDVTRWDADLAFGIIWGITPEGTGHAFNWFIDTDKKVWFVEPQTDEIFEPTDKYQISRTMI